MQIGARGASGHSAAQSSVPALGLGQLVVYFHQAAHHGLHHLLLFFLLVLPQVVICLRCGIKCRHIRL